MEKLTNEQRALRKELANKYSKAQLEARDEALKTFPEEIRKFLLHSYRDDEGLNGPVGKKLQEGLASGKYEKPSQFVIEELSCIFGTILPETLKESLLYSVDECRRCAYSYGYYRRPFRSRDYALYAEKVHTIIYAYAMNTYVKKQIHLFRYFIFSILSMLPAVLLLQLPIASAFLRLLITVVAFGAVYGTLLFASKDEFLTSALQSRFMHKNRAKEQ